MISIIIPAYNIGKYIKNGLDSIRQQTYEDYEVIVVNDGSTDDTLSVLNSYKDEYQEFPLFIIDKPNGGVTAARRDGFLASKGEWIYFMDGDDVLPLESLQKLVRSSSNDVDIVCGSYQTFDETGVVELKKINVSPGVYDSEFLLDIMLLGKYNSAPWAKIIRKDCIPLSAFAIPQTITNKEDIIMNYRINSSLKGSISFIEDVVYNYRINRIDSAFNKKYAKGKGLNLTYELDVMRLYFFDLLNKKQFVVNHQKSLSVFSYNCLWYFHKYFCSIKSESKSKSEIRKIYNFIRFMDIDENLVKKTIKYTLLLASLKRYGII
ncbi:MAG: glycosyltransferase family 2 protein [Paludibacteraceae bacterium]|nr:glycosyltransferase family 2 protein [Paludibacteraceae bacterium]